MSVRDGYSPTKAGEIPRGWQFVRLADACEIVGGSTPSKIVADYWNGDIPFATPTDITGLNGRNILDGTKSRITKKGFESISAKLLPPGSVLITSRATIGYCAINDSPVVTNQGFASLICKEGVHNLFMLYLMRSLKRKLERLATGSTFREVPRSSLRKLLISLPSYNEQQKIASVLLTVDEDIQKTDEIIAETQQLKKGLMQQLLTKGIGHTKFKKTEIGEIPEEWEVTKLGDVLKDIRYGTSAKANSQRKGFPVLGIPNVIEGRIEDKDLRQVELSEPETQATTIEEGDILIVRTNANPDYIGRCALFEKRMGTWLYASYLIRVRADSKRVLPAYLSRFLQSEIIRKAFLRIARTSAGNYNVNTRNIRSMVVCLPQLAEQQKIVSILSGIDEKMEKETDRKVKLENVKKGLMQVLLSGKVRVNVN